MVQLFPRRVERPMNTLFTELAELQVQAADVHSKMLGHGYRERARLAPRLHDLATRAEEQCRRIANRLSDSLITPYEAELMYDLALTLADAVDAMENTAELLVLFRVGRLPTSLLEVAKGLERAAEVMVTATWKLDRVRELDEMYAQTRKIKRQGDRLIRQAQAEMVKQGGAATDLVPLREVTTSIAHTVDLQERAARRVDLLRVKDA